MWYFQYEMVLVIKYYLVVGLQLVMVYGYVIDVGVVGIVEVVQQYVFVVYFYVGMLFGKSWVIDGDVGFVVMFDQVGL